MLHDSETVPGTVFCYYSQVTSDPQCIVVENKRTLERMEQATQHLGYLATRWSIGGGPYEPQVMVLCQTTKPLTDADRGNISEHVVRYLVREKCLPAP